MCRDKNLNKSWGALIVLTLLCGCGRQTDGPIAPQQQAHNDVREDVEKSAKTRPPEPAVAGTDPVADELKRFAGTWQYLSEVDDGVEKALDDIKVFTWIQDEEGNWQVLIDGQVVSEGTQKELDPAANPKILAGEYAPGKYHGIYRFVGDTVEMCTVPADRPRPTAFTSLPGSGHLLQVCKRVSDATRMTPAQRRPDAQRVARRAMVLSLVMYRASLEKFAGQEKYETLHAKLPLWIDKLGLDSELEPAERDLLLAPLGKADARVALNSLWRNEGLVVLAWALKRFELPRYDEQADPVAAAASIGFSEDLLGAMDTAAAEKLLREAELRPADEIDRYATHATLVNWRLRTQRLGTMGAEVTGVVQKGMDFVGYLRAHPSFRESWLNGLRLVGQDLAIGDVAIGEADVADVDTCEGTAVERQVAGYWLQGDDEVYSRVDSPTILLGLGESLALADGPSGEPARPDADEKRKRILRERIEREIGEQMLRLGVPGVSVAVINDYAIEWARGYGVREAGGNTAVDTDTLFQAASISKPVAALAVLRLVEDGQLNLDDEANTRLTTWKVPDNELTAAQKVTLRRLLSHTAGLSVHGFDGYSVFHPVPTLDEILDGVLGKSNSEPVRVFLTPGSQLQYSGGGYCIAQQLVTDVTGKAFPEWMRSAVLDPLAMQHSTYEQPLPKARWTAAASGHAWNGQPLLGRWHTYPEMAAAGLWTTPSDLARFAIEIRSAWTGRPDRIVSQQTAKDMLTPQPGGWGLGLIVRGEGDGTWFDHSGANAGFRCHLIASVNGRGAVVMTNSDNGAALLQAVMRSIARAYDWPPIALAAPEAQVAGNNPFGVVDVLLPDGKDVELFAASVQLPGDAQDANAAVWGMKLAEELPSIDGDWSSRWNYDTDAGSWATGSATIKTVGKRVYILYQEGEGRYLIDTRREGNRLIGKSLNLQDHRDTYPWVGLVVDNQRIDGAWTFGRWDFRRQFEGPAAGGDVATAPATVADILAPLVTDQSPGAAVLVIRDGKIEHQAGYGLADLEHGTPITAETLFHLASTGKQFTALGIMMLKEEGKLGYDDPIGKHLPELSRLGDAVTIRRLLHHTSGVPEYYDALYSIAALSSGKHLPTNADGLLTLSKWGEVTFAPGERFEYSNTGYELLGLLIERVSGQSFVDFIGKRVFDPLEMKSTFSMPNPNRLADPERARGYQPAAAGFSVHDSDRLDNLVGAGSIYSNLADLYRYDQALYTDKLVSQTTLAEAYHPARLNDGSESPYGFAQFVGEHNGHSYRMHSGAWVGYVSTYAHFPDEKLSVIVLWNRSDVATEEIAFQIADLYLNHEQLERK